MSGFEHHTLTCFDDAVSDFCQIHPVGRRIHSSFIYCCASIHLQIGYSVVVCCPVLICSSFSCSYGDWKYGQRAEGLGSDIVVGANCCSVPRYIIGIVARTYLSLTTRSSDGSCLTVYKTNDFCLVFRQSCSVVPSVTVTAGVKALPL